jgi:restriction system protein
VTGGTTVPIPDFQSIMRPLLELASDGKEHSISDAREELAKLFALTEDEKKALLPSGRQSTFNNRVAWARVYLGQAGAFDTPRRGHFRITTRGRELLRSASERIKIKDLERFPEFVEFRTPKDHPSEPAHASDDEGQTPEELLETAYLRFRTNIASELLTRVKAASSQFLERLVVELLLKMGYGGSRKESWRGNWQGWR